MIEQAKRQQPCVLFVDEVDSFLEARDGRGDGVKEDRDLVNAMLTLTVDIRQSRVILIAATNHLDESRMAGDAQTNPPRHPGISAPPTVTTNRRSFSPGGASPRRESVPGDMAIAPA